MKILLLGDFSGLHVNLAEGLRALGHQVTVASDGNGYKNYYRDIDISWSGRFRYIKMITKLLKLLPRFTGYDVVQLIGMPFLDLRPLNNAIVFRYLKAFNTSIFLGSNTIETEYMKYSREVGFKTSFTNNKWVVANDAWAKEYSSSIMHPRYSLIHKYVTDRVNGITACCAEYNLACQYYYPYKSQFIPLPYNVGSESNINTIDSSDKVRFFLGKQSYRIALKGMDVIESALLALKDKYPDEVELTIVDSIPYDEYRKLMESSHVICDQLYSYGAGLNAVIAMSKGLVVAGGGEDYMYDLFGEKSNKALINLPEDQEGVYAVLEDILKRKNELASLSEQSRAFALKHHGHVKVAQQYVDFWQSKM